MPLSTEKISGESYNIYLDESCHLENDHQKVMGLDDALAMISGEAVPPDLR